MPEHPGIPQPPAEIRERVSKHVWIKLTGPEAGSLTKALCQSVAGLQDNVSVKVVTPRDEDAAHKDDGRVKPVTVPPTMIVMEGKAAGAQKYIKVEKMYRIVLLGDTKTGKSSLANSMFGEDMFKVDDTERQTGSKSVHGRRITLINTPDLLCTSRSEEEMKPEIMRCITECTAAPHAFLIVLKVEKSTEQQQQQQAVIEKIKQYFSEEVFKYATVVFIQDGPDSDEMKVKEFIVQNKYLSDLVKKCKSRYHIINKYNHQGDSSQSKVAELLNTIDQVVKENKGVCYSNKMMPQGDTCNKANSSISKNEMIKLVGAAAESVAKAFSGSAVVVLTPGSTTTGKEKDGTETDKKEEENGDGKATSEITNNGLKQKTKEEEGGGRKKEEDATSEKMNDEQTEMSKDEEEAAAGGEEPEEGATMNDEQTEMTKEENGEITKEKEERKSEVEVAKEAQEVKTTGKSNKLEQDKGPNETQEEKDKEAGEKLQKDTQEKMEGKVEEKPQKTVQESARENKLGGGGPSAGGGAAAGGVVAAGALLTAAGVGVAAGALSAGVGVAAGALSTGAGVGVAAGAAVESVAGATGAGASAGTAGGGGAAARYVAAAAVATGGAVGVAWLKQKIRKVIEWIKQQLGVVLLVLVFYSLLLSWFFLKVPFVGTLLLSFMLLLLVIILVII